MNFFKRHSSSGLKNVFTVDWPTSSNIFDYDNDVNVTLPKSVLELKVLTLNLL